MSRTLCFVLLGIAAILGLVSANPVNAQGYPSRTVTLVAATTPGSLPDVLARAVGQRLATKWRQAVVVENRAGGAYAIAASAVANAPADGYTLLVTESGFYTTQPHLSKARSTYAQTDFVPVSGMASVPMAFIAHPSLEANSIKELIALAKAKPGTVNYGTAGPGTAPHMGVLLLANMAKVDLTAVHYRGVSPALSDLIAGHIKLLSIGPSIALPAFKAGSIKVLGVGSERPVAQLNNAQPVAADVPGFEMSVSFSIFAKTGTPADLIEKINADVQEVVRDSEFQKQFLEPQALQAMEGSSQQLAKALSLESDKWQKLIKETNLVID